MNNGRAWRCVRCILTSISVHPGSDEDLSNFYLTEKQRGIHRPVTEHEEAEILMGKNDVPCSTLCST